MGEDFWKNAYKEMWGNSSIREEKLAEFIKQATGYIAAPYGLGAGSDNFFHGSAAKNGYEKGDADYQVVDTNIFLEITGPLSDLVGEEAPLWFRPDKIQNAMKNINNNHDTFLVHNCPKGNIWRVIHVNDTFLRDVRNGKYSIVHPNIRGNSETYYEIPASDNCICDISVLVDYIKNYGKIETNKICPLCGAELIIRTARRGVRAGNRFWGCSNFPECNYLKNVD